jgi:uncharacterized membrane protein YraQ (UPF0718 family)
MWEAMFWGFCLRSVQALAQAAPFIAVGLFVSAILRRLLGYDGTRRLFGEGTRRSLLHAWVIGMLLPVDSLGAIPIIRDLRKAGISGGTILAFAMSAPLFNPLSLLYGLTLSEPLAILAFAFCSLVVVTVVGCVWDRIFPDTKLSQEAIAAAAPKEVPAGIKRMLSIVSTTAHESAGPSLAYVVLGLIGVGLLGAGLPHGSLQHSMNSDNPAAPMVMAGVAIPAYATPMLAMSQLGMMFQHANSIGAAFVLLTLGAGMNLGLLCWMLRHYGWRRSAVWMGLLLVVVLGLAYGVDKPLAPAGIEPADHTHAFDIYCRPFEPGQTPNLADAALRKLRRDVQPWEWYSLYGLGGLVAAGVVLRLLDRRGMIEDWLTRLDPRPADVWRRIDVDVPGPVLGAVALVGLIAFSVVGCYAYYPAPEEVFEEMRIANGEALSASLSGDAAHAKYWLEVSDDWTRKLQVGVYLRDWQLSDYHQMKARLLRDKMEFLEHAVNEGDKDEVRQLVTSVQQTYSRLRSAYLEER